MPIAYRIDKEHIVYRIINREAILLNLDSGFYYSLNKAGAYILEQLEAGKSKEEIVSSLMKKFKLGQARLKKDVESLVKDLKREGIICEKND